MKHPEMTILMKTGNTIVIELYPEVAPNSVASIIALANKKYYDGRKFYRVVKDYIIQTDCDKNWENEDGCDYIIGGEYKNSGHDAEAPVFERYTCGMAGTGGTSDLSSGSSFFIMMGRTPRLDGNCAVIGKVVAGFDEVDRINSVAVKKTMYYEYEFYQPIEAEIMEKVTVECFGATYPAPVTRPFTDEYLKGEEEIYELLGMKRK